MFEKEDLLGNVRSNEAAFRATLEQLYDLPIVGDVRGDGYFYGIELVKDKATRETFSDEESERLLRGFLSHALFDAGLICRADDRGDPVIQLSPPLTCTQEHFTEIEQILRGVLTEAWSRKGPSPRDRSAVACALGQATACRQAGPSESFTCSLLLIRAARGGWRVCTTVRRRGWRRLGGPTAGGRDDGWQRDLAGPRQPERATGSPAGRSGRAAR